MVPIRPQTIGSNNNTQRPGDKNATFGQRRMPRSASFTNSAKKSSFRAHEDDDNAMEISWVPTSSSSATGGKDERQNKSKTARDKLRKGIETFGAGLERGVEEFSNDSEKKGRSHRRKGVRSGSKNTFRRL